MHGDVREDASEHALVIECQGTVTWVITDELIIVRISAQLCFVFVGPATYKANPPGIQTPANY